MSGCCIIKSLRATLAADRAAYRATRNRLILAEASLLPALDEWQAEGDPVARGHLRWIAGRKARDVRKARRRHRSVIAAMRGASEALHTAMAERAR